MEQVFQRLGVTQAQIQAFCERWNVARFELFGSVLRDDFDSESDIDALVTFGEGAQPGLDGLLDMEEELQSLFGRRVDLIKRRLVESSPNYIRRRRILESAVPIYASPR
jgi:hypothetical protein